MRKLALISASFSTAVFLCVYLVPAEYVIPAAAFCIALGVLAFVSHRKALLLCFLALSAGFLRFGVQYYAAIVPARALDGITREIKAEISAFPSTGESYTMLEVKIDGPSPFPLGARIYDYTGDTAELKPGDMVTMTAKLRSAETRYGVDDPYYNSRNIYLTGTYKGDLSITDRKGFYLPALPEYIQSAVSNKAGEIFPEDISPFMKALLIGDRSEFYSDLATETAFSLSGFMHVVAISGMHIGFLVGFVLLILGRGPRASAVSLVIIWIFALASGASPSVLRASFMQTMLLTAPIFRREDDPLTSLSFALMLLLLLNPYSAASLSLQLSFSALAGIVLFSDRIYKALIKAFKLEKRHGLVVYPVGVVASSAAVFIFSAPIIALNFGYVQLLSVFTNLFGLWAVSLCFCMGEAAVALAFILPAVGKIIAFLTAFPARYILGLVRLIAALPLCSVYLERKLLFIWLTLSYAGFLLAVLIKKGGRLRIILPVCGSLALLAALIIGVKAYYSSAGGFITVLDVGQGQCVSAFSGDTTVVADCGGKAVSENPGSIAGAYLRSCGRSSVDYLVISHAHNDHANGVLQLLELVDVKNILISPPEEENELYSAILASAERHGTAVTVISADRSFESGNIRLRLIAPPEGEEDNANSLMLIMSVGEYDMLLTGDSPAKSERRLLKTTELSEIESYIVAHHGSKYSNTEALISTLGADTAIISVGYNTYGHPTQEVLELLQKYAYNIFRTDENGNIVIRIDDTWQEKTIKTSKN